VTVQEILDRISLLIDHELTNAQVITQLNQLSLLMFRKMPVPDKFYKFTTTSTPYYDLPTDCAEDRIRSVIIDDIEFEMVKPEDQDPPYYFCMVVVNKLYVTPNTADQEAFLYYKPRHVELVATDLTATPTFPEDYHEMLVYGAAKWIASTQRDVDLVNNFQREYDEIMRDAEKNLRKAGMKRVKETTEW
jgi:hypothetical protein